MSSKDGDCATSFSKEDASQSKDDNFEEIVKGNADLLENPKSVKPSCSVNDDINNAETLGNTGTTSTCENKKNLTEQTGADFPVENLEASALSSLEDEFSSDTQEEELKLMWDDDDISLELPEQNITPLIGKNSHGALDKVISKDLIEDLLETNNTALKETDNLSKTEGTASYSSSITSHSKSLADSVLVNKDHGINKPDVMLDIPGMLPDMDDELESLTLEMISDDKQLNLDDEDQCLSKFDSEISAGMKAILSPLEERELNVKLEMPSDNGDNLHENSSTTDKTKFVKAIQNEMKLLTDTMSSIEEQDGLETNEVDLTAITTQPVIDELNLITAVNNEVKSLGDTISNIDKDEQMENVPITISDHSPEPTYVSTETNPLEPQATPSEQRQKDIKLKVSTLISNIEEEMELLDSNDEMEFEVKIEPKCKPVNVKVQKKSPPVRKVASVQEIPPKPELIPEKKELNESKIRQKEQEEIVQEIPPEPEIIPEKKELNESELRQKEQDEIVLAIKAIEQKNEIHQHLSTALPTPAVTLVNVNPADEVSEISVIDEDDQPSISLVLDDEEESIEVLDECVDPVSALIDESEVSVIQDSEDDEPAILMSDSDNITENITLNIPQSAEMLQTNDIQSEGTPDVENKVSSTKCIESVKSKIDIQPPNMSLKQSAEMQPNNEVQPEEIPVVKNEIISTKYKELKIDAQEKGVILNQESTESKQKAAESEKVELEITADQEIYDEKKDKKMKDIPSITMKDEKAETETSKDKSSESAHNNKVDDKSMDEVEKNEDTTLTDSTMSNKDEATKCLENENIKLLLTSQDADGSHDVTLLPSEKVTSKTEQNKNVTEIPDQDPDHIEPQPSTSTVDLDINKDSSNDIPDSDTLGLLAESTRVMDDDDDEDDDDDDFYQDDESNLMTAEHSEDSNNPSDDAQDIQDVMETDEKEMTKDTKLENSNVSMDTEQDNNKQELMTPEQQEEEFQFTISNVTNDMQKGDADVSESDVQLDDKVDPGVLNTDAVKGPESVEVEKAVTEKVATSDASEIEVEKTPKDQESTSAPAKKVDKSPDKMKSLSISSQQAVWNFVDLEESSEDEIQVLPKPDEMPATSKKLELQPDVAEPKAKTQPEKGTSPGRSEMAPALVAETAAEADVEMSMEVLDEELLKVDDSSENSGDVPKNFSAVHEENSTKASKKQPEEVNGLEVFNLDSDEEDTTAQTAPVEAPVSQPQQEPEPEPEPTKRDFKCINNSCQSGPDVRCHAADTATLAYYDGDKRRHAFVCEDCLQPVLTRNEELMEGIRNYTPLLELDMSTHSLDLVEISDSDSDGEPEAEDQDKDKIGDVSAKFLEENLADMINETWVKFQMDSRLSDTESVLQMELRRLEAESKEIHTFLTDCQATTDKIRNELYATFPQDIRQVPPLLMYDTPDQQYCYVQALLPQKEAEVGPVPTRMSKRRLEASASAENPAKRPAIPLGYTPLEALEQFEKKAAGMDAEDMDKVEKVDDDNVDVSVVNIISSETAPPGLPPPGELVKPPLRVGMTVYAMRNSFGSWVKGKILEIMPKGTSLAFTTCKVKFENRNSKTPVKTVLARCMAYSEPAAVRLTIGTRVIANFKDNKDNKEPPQMESKRESFFSGIVSEVPNPVNNYRYLIFFDDGYAQYASHADTRLVCECSSLVWEEVHPFSREFVREYLLAYPERPMVRLHAFQSLKTEWNGKWWSSRVVAVDASLAQVHFPANNRYEWIYRGSTRLAPLYLELQAAERHRARPMPRAQAHSRANMPVVEYTRYDEQSNKSFEQDKTTQMQKQEVDAIRQRAVAKKSTGSVATQTAPPARMPPGHNLDNVTSRVVYYTPKNAVKPHKMLPHTCGPKCKRTDVLSLKELRTYNPLAKPLLSGWERQIVRYKGQKAVMYRAPCGRRVRCVRELHRYLRAARSDLPVDLFDFSPATHCLAEFVLNKCLIMKKDLSQGKENVPVPCVNYYDESLPEFCLYNTERTPTTGVPLNLDPEFLCGCDCEDDCEDKTKCACWKLTLEGARTIGLEGDNVGYVYKRLPEPLPSGIYECNSRCKCKYTCLNRVAQHPLQLKLQIFKTLNRGWGIRALNDVPKGSFLCVYAGNLLTDATANLDGLNEGDEYLAELDYIEVVEQMKEGYEEDIPKDLKKMSLKDNGEEDTDQEEESSEEESQETSKNELEDDDFQPAPHVGIRVTQFSKRLRQRNRNKEGNTTEEKKESDKDKEKREEKEKEEPKKESEKGSNDEDCITISDDDEVREPSSFAAAAGMGANAFVSKYRSVRSLFGEDEACYIMDAKVQGNIGRYLNHSCSPNVFVQNVFVDTHDPRFPWVAFFALSHVRAGTELTWNYNYDVGSVPGKALYCYCGAANCRGRLL